jgi:sortase A
VTLGRWALALVLVGAITVGVYVRSLYAPDQAAVHHQKEQVAEIQKGVSLRHCSGALIRVPSWGRDYVMPIVNSVSQKTLDSGVVGHFPRTGPLGVGNYALAGHVVTHGEPFAKLLGMRPGQIIEIDKCGRRYMFKAQRKFNVDYHNVSVLDYSPRTITLTTCASRFVHTDIRTIVVGRLIRVA